MAKDIENEMSFLEHLEVLRWHLIRAFLGILVVAIIAFIFKDIVFNRVLLAPKLPEFITNRLLCDLGRRVNVLKLCINSQPFEVIGILESVGAGVSNNNPDGNVFIPLTTAEQRLFGREELNNISARVRDGVTLERAMVDIERVLRREHKILPGQPNDFAVIDRRQFLETQQEAQQTFTALLASIAGVSLLVGGIGIMNNKKLFTIFFFDICYFTNFIYS